MKYSLILLVLKSILINISFKNNIILDFPMSLFLNDEIGIKHDLPDDVKVNLKPYFKKIFPKDYKEFSLGFGTNSTNDLTKSIRITLKEWKPWIKAHQRLCKPRIE
jgi:hypothetical protein